MFGQDGSKGMWLPYRDKQRKCEPIVFVGTLPRHSRPLRRAPRDPDVPLPPRLAQSHVARASSTARRRLTKQTGASEGRSPLQGRPSRRRLLSPSKCLVGRGERQPQPRRFCVPRSHDRTVRRVGARRAGRRRSERLMVRRTAVNGRGSPTGLMTTGRASFRALVTFSGVGGGSVFSPRRRSELVGVRDA